MNSAEIENEIENEIEQILIEFIKYSRMYKKKDDAELYKRYEQIIRSLVSTKEDAEMLKKIQILIMMRLKNNTL